MFSRILRKLTGWRRPALRPGHRPAKTWTDFQRLRRGGKEPGYRRLNKLEVAELAAAIGVPVPEQLRTYSTVADIDLASLPERFVLKPDGAKSREGVLLLHRQPGGEFRDALRRRSLTAEEIFGELEGVARLHAERFPKRPPIHFLAEELLLPDDGSDRIPFDYKALTAGGEVLFIFQVDRNHAVPAAAFFHRDFEVRPGDPAAVSAYRSLQPGEPVVPRYADDILDIARRVTAHLRTPFASIDCYSTSRGAVLGEITLTPGGPYYGNMYRLAPALEIALGAAYLRGYRELGLEPATVPTEYAIKHRGGYRRVVDENGLSLDGYAGLRR
ncbi:MAG TPA: ATP-grasp fold amidoligase family protein [Devosia sp.]|nr:ATP-grasp fold amidoligase family protein [Devosia sp.]